MKNRDRFLTLAMLIGSSACAQSLNDSLIAHFPFDGSPVDGIDGLSPTVTEGSPGFCADRNGTVNSAACFDGASFWSYGDVLDMDTSDFSISCWLYVDSVQEPFQVVPGFWTYGGLPIDKGLTIQGHPQRAGYGLFAREYQPGSYTVLWGTGGSSDDVTYSAHGGLLDVWQHVVVSRCGTHQTLHIDGQLVADSVTAGARNLNTDIVFTFGAMNRDPSSFVDTEHFIGALDEVRIYKGRCLSQPEIDTLAGLFITGVPLLTDPAYPGVRILPNPAQGRITVRFDQPIDLEMSLNILDASGRMINSPSRVMKVVPQGYTAIEIPLDGMAPGVYFVRLTSQQGTWYERFFKE